jgi:hypothetical protein
VGAMKELNILHPSQKEAREDFIIIAEQNIINTILEPTLMQVLIKILVSV